MAQPGQPVEVERRGIDRSDQSGRLVRSGSDALPQEVLPQGIQEMGRESATCPAAPPLWPPAAPAVARGILDLGGCTLACVPKVPLPGGPIAVGGRGPGSCEDAYVEGLPLGGGPDSDCLAAMDSLGCWCVLGLVHRGSGGHPGSTRHPVLGAGRGRGRDGRDAFGVVAALVADAPARPGREFPGLGIWDGGRSRGRDKRSATG